MTTDTDIAYNEIDPYAVEYMRWLMAAGLIAPGYIFTCSIEDLTPRDVSRFVQFHAFAGTGAWSYALRLAGWPDDRPIWTGSCPCQPFSEAGKNAGFADERHLWPAFFHLITTCRPERVVGEQVAGKNGLAWLDLVSFDMEAADYTFRAVPLCSAGFGSPDIRNRMYWMGDAAEQGRERLAHGREPLQRPQRPALERTGGEPAVWLAYAHDTERRADAAGGHDRDRPYTGRAQGAGDVEGCSGPGGMADAPSVGRGTGLRDSEPTGECGPVATDGRGDGGMADGESGGRRQERAVPRRAGEGDRAEGRPPGHDLGGGLSRVADANVRQPPALTGDVGQECGVPIEERRPEHGSPLSGRGGAVDGPGPLNGFWRAADWLYCRDDRWRPVAPGAFPLGHGISARVGRLRAAGNSINPRVASEFIKAVMAEDAAS